MKLKDADLLENNKLKLQAELNDLLHSSNPNQDEINALKSEILYLNKKIEKIIGKKGLECRKELNKRKDNTFDWDKQKYYSLKLMVKRISPMNVATNRILNTISKLDLRNDGKVKVR